MNQIGFERRTRQRWQLFWGSLVSVLVVITMPLPQPGRRVLAATESNDAVQGYATVMTKTARIWQSLDFDDSVSAAPVYHRTLAVHSVKTIANGSRYLELYDRYGQRLGYLNETLTQRATTSKGAPLAVTRYLTVTADNLEVYQGFDSAPVSTTGSYLHQTLLAKRLYYRFDGKAYYSLYNKMGQWLGYFDSAAVQEGSGNLGSGLSEDSYVTLTNSGFSLYRDFWTKKASAASYVDRTYHVRYSHRAYNGSEYLSLYDAADSYIGIVNRLATKAGAGPQGAPRSVNIPVVLTNTKATLWRNFSWTPLASATQYQDAQLTAKCAFYHLNGSTYYSLYDSQDKWAGYVNAAATTSDLLKTAFGAAFNSYVYVAIPTGNKASTWTSPNGQKAATLYTNGTRLRTKRARLIGSRMWYQLTNGLWSNDIYLSLTVSNKSRGYTTSIKRNRVRTYAGKSATVYDAPGGHRVDTLGTKTIPTFSNRSVFKNEMWFKIGINRWVRRTQAYEVLPYQNPAGVFQVLYDKIQPVGQIGYNLGYSYEGVKTWLVLGKLGLSRSYNNMSVAAVAAVRRFQASHGLPANGVVDLATWKKLGLSASLWTSLDRYVHPLGAQWYNDRSEHIEAIIAAAYEYLGNPYMVGASSTPSYGVDCSGLVMQALYAAGISPVPVSSIQHAQPGNEWNSRLLAASSKFKTVAYSARQRGDLIFYKEPGTGLVWHVAIYLGHDQVIEAWPPKVMVAPIKNSHRNWVSRVARPFQ
ncbi:C40 family peptidase [Lacticaseibacillus yichunensis]|uniref:NlpC/P60 family protein n=1 Tax=Lacticaseibacillus yichunensis TaxID=2486015 RepID=A0ABW4CTM3_9LACO|nr:NlpC/P60 family protein [Lacticaseibacillus yichunensis]